VERRGRFAVAVPGGRTPEPMFRALAGGEQRTGGWRGWEVFWGDERMVPEEDPRSNYALAKREWLGPGRVPPGQVHPVVTTIGAADGAHTYEALLRSTFGPTPSFDAIVLGVGPDGHTASLFPGAGTLDADDRWVVPEPNPALPPRVPRVTLTLQALRSSQVAIFLVCGEEKRGIVAEVLRESSAGGPPPALPAARVTARESVEWYLDRAVAPTSPPGPAGS